MSKLSDAGYYGSGNRDFSDSRDLAMVTQGAFERVLSPISLKRVSLRNRIVMTAHRKAMDIPTLPGPNETAYLARRAQGGVGLIVTEVSAVHPTSMPHEFMPIPFDRSKIPAASEEAAAVKAHGAKIFGQIYHCGAQSTTGFYSERPLWAPSELRGMGSLEIAHCMTKFEIREVVDGFGESARNLIEAGFDGVELHGGHGYLIQQFFSPLTNRRQDEYGGSFENRIRFAVEVIAAVRAATGPDFPIGLKISADERLQGGLTPSHMAEVAKALEATGELDYLCVSNGTHESYELLVPDGSVPMGEAGRYAADMKKHVSLPVIAVGRIHAPEIAEAFIATGKADLVGMLRSLIADPDLPKRMAEGSVADIRPCIGVNYCLRRLHNHSPLRCAVNPQVGHERDQISPLDHRLRVVVVGGGPAGLEAAMAARSRGAEVTLYEASQRLGGQLGQATSFPGKEGIASLLRYYEYQISKAGVAVRVGERIESLNLLAGSADAIIVATGTRRVPSPWHDRDEDSMRRWDGPSLYEGDWGQLAGQDLSGKRVVLVESEAIDYVAATLAAFLITRAAELRIVTSFASFAAGLDSPNSNRLARMITERQIKVYANSYLLPPNDGRIRIFHRGLKNEMAIDQVDLVVTSGTRIGLLPDGCSDGFANGARVLYAGDCVAPRGVAEAIREGRHAAASL